MSHRPVNFSFHLSGLKYNLQMWQLFHLGVKHNKIMLQFLTNPCFQLLNGLQFWILFSSFWLEIIIYLESWHFHSHLQDYSGLFHFPTGPLKFHFQLPKSKIYLPQAIGPWFFPALAGVLGLFFLGHLTSNCNEYCKFIFFFISIKYNWF